MSRLTPAGTKSDFFKKNVTSLRLFAVIFCLILLASTLFIPLFSVDYKDKVDVVYSTAYVTPFELARGYIDTPGPEFKDIFKTAPTEISDIKITNYVFYMYPNLSIIPLIIVSIAYIACIAAIAFTIKGFKVCKLKPAIVLTLCSGFLIFVLYAAYSSMIFNSTNTRYFTVNPSVGFVLAICVVLIAFTILLSFYRSVRNQKYLLIMLAPFVAWTAVFSYLPMAGWVMAFKEYNPGENILLSEWANPIFDNFMSFILNSDFFLIMRNTIVLNFSVLFLATPLAVFLAIMFSEIRFLRFKKVVQTASYLPYFISWVIVASITDMFFTIDNGLINELLTTLNIVDEQVPFLQRAEYFPPLIIFLQLWKTVGWETIIYLSAITSINPDLYEAASIDGASRVAKILRITLPCIIPTAIVLLIMNSGWILNGFDPYYLIGNSTNREWSEVIDTYTFRMGVNRLDYSMSTAIGMFKTTLGLILLVITNKLGKKYANVEILR